MYHITNRSINSPIITEKSKEVIDVSDEVTIEKIVKKVQPFNHMDGQKRYILTGGPGAGKTSIINVLAKSGYLCMPEAATDVINHGIEIGIHHPWKNEDYHINMYQLIIKRQFEAQSSSDPVVFFDRGHLDGISYILLQKRKLFKYIVDCVQASLDCHFFQKSVFFIESLGFVVPGPARTESIQESLQKAECLEHNYRSLGYEIIRIPPASIEKRAQMIIDHIKQLHGQK
jgi:predicted ATPase